MLCHLWVFSLLWESFAVDSVVVVVIVVNTLGCTGHNSVDRTVNIEHHTAVIVDCNIGCIVGAADMHHTADIAGQVGKMRHRAERCGRLRKSCLIVLVVH